MSKIAAQYQVTEVPDSVIRKEIVMESVRDKNGKHVGFKQVVREKKGGLFYSFPNGNSIMLDKPIERGPAQQLMDDLSDLKDGDEVPLNKRVAKTQLETFGLTDRPRLFDLTTGDEVDERGVPLAIVGVLNPSAVPNDLPVHMQPNKNGERTLDDAIADTE